ncbi:MULTISPECIES: serine hydrolase domain-containing protein [Sphingomonas]|uniref:Beta-lactamase family protein n=1 Tax=Sphingomonas zeae TaxID=1646122 RepID=A0A7Y6B460_9SPHN|nr:MULTISPECIES: serine hydrolase domain-containing protein [Sphingomonas]MDK8184748.1 serine hydrolase domain-containing protein [Sphingomonas zeae]MDK8215469.1 serine hydrolase domain-containing protein [Sphingomonas sp. UMB7805-LC452B]NUU46923.1 beta-lactamase family protein [Sphingomonas zeae]
MRRVMMTGGAMLALLSAAAPAQIAQPRAHASVAGLPATQALFDSYVRTGKMPGIVAAIGTPGQPAVFVSAGRTGLEPDAPAVGPDTLWRVYSMTKPITAMAAMILIEDGKLKLDQPVSDIYPAYQQMRVLTNPDASLQTRPATRPITIRNLLTHTAGLGYSITTKGPLLKEYERLGIVPFAANAQVEAKVRPTRPVSLQQFAERVAALPLIAEPGTKWSYSIGLDVMAAVVEKVAGMPFERFVQTRLFTPLKMNSSYWQVPASAANRLVSNYTFLGDRMVPIDPAANSVFRQRPSFPYGGAGLVMSARDYDRFLQMLQNGGQVDGVRVMKPETVRLAMSNLLPAGVTYGSVSGATGGSAGEVPTGFGAGGSVTLADTPGGPGKGTYGWGGAAGTIAYVDPARQMRGVVMVNYFPADRYPLRRDLAATLHQDLGHSAK